MNFYMLTNGKNATVLATDGDVQRYVDEFSKAYNKSRDINNEEPRLFSCSGSIMDFDGNDDFAIQLEDYLTLVGFRVSRVAVFSIVQYN